MSILGKLLANRRAGESGLAWNQPNLLGDTVFRLTSTDFEPETTLDIRHASRRIGGADESPTLSWSGAPDTTTGYLLVVEDPDAPMRKPFVHCVALLEPSVRSLSRNALRADTDEAGVRVLRSGFGRGYLGPAPIKGHGPHRYVFELFALGAPLTTAAGKPVESAKPREVLAAAQAVGRARIDGFYERP
ncbi:YbhB/YbcL family Raf kinase inhibitor-like protein [Nocardia mikamii]|uniref:YbhB/YbcL family Raf kinase inhibitor-like protein n=1 Tax=Nocardia mikamii TaxID=508464 RepID=UPI0007A4865B|nr:YbhB/YbcL family Raf kinase inhibitor-like protein [Nocardia mikamii]